MNVINWRMFQVSFSHTSFHSAQNEKSFGWDWKIIRLRLKNRSAEKKIFHPPNVFSALIGADWNMAERWMKHPSGCNLFVLNNLWYSLKDEGWFAKLTGEERLLKLQKNLRPKFKIVSHKETDMPCFLYFCLRYQDIRPNDMEDKLIELIENSIKKNWDR